MKNQTSQTDLSPNNPLRTVAPQSQQGTELYDSPTPDSYDAHIIPAETAARKEHEGSNFKHLQHTTSADGIDTTGGFTVDKEGLLDNFGIEPEMYYQTHGDLPSNVRKEGIRQEGIRQEGIHQEEVRQEGIRQEGIHQEKLHQEEIRQEEIRQEGIRQEGIHQEKLHQEEIRQEGIRQEKLHQEEVRQEEVRQEEVRQEGIRQEKLHQEEVRQQECIRLGVGLFSNHETTETALHDLKNSSFLMERVSVVGRDIYRYPEFAGVHSSNQLADTGTLHTHDNKAQETAQDGAIAGGAIGGFAGLLVGLGLMFIPGVGPVMLAGAAATAIATAISGGIIGAATVSLAGGLVGLGIPSDRAELYSDRISHGDYLVMVEGSDADIALAESIFSKHGIDEWYIYDLSSDLVRTIKTPSTHRLQV